MSSNEDKMERNHHLLQVKPANGDHDILELTKKTSAMPSDCDSLNRASATIGQTTASSADVPELDNGVRMLCMDGGGAKGVIEATILDKIFTTVATTLKYEVHLLNWVTLILDRECKENKGDTLDTRLEAACRDIVNICNEAEPRGSATNYKSAQKIDRTHDLGEKRQCTVICGLIDDKQMYQPLTHRQKIAILESEKLRNTPGLQIIDFLHGASKYWVFLDSDQSDETREAITEHVCRLFDSKKKMKGQNKCLKLLIPAGSLVLKQTPQNIAKYENKDLLVFYWGWRKTDVPVKTKRAIEIRDELLGVDDLEWREKHNPSLFIEELRASEMFDLLIGTSTGSILAFGMGYKGLSPQECRDVYLKSIQKIFSSTYDRSVTNTIGLKDTVFRTVGDLVGQGHYSIEAVSDTLEENYNKDREQSARTKMGGGEHRRECVCACVALNWEEQALETFDTHNAKYADWDLIQFLTASSDAPVYFTTPYTVKDPDGVGTAYIDGGLGANCPAKQGIDLAKARWPGCDIELILSLGAGKDKNPPVVPKTGGDWLKELCSMVTNGDKIWHNFVIPLLQIDESCRHTEKLRIQPALELAHFKADSVKVVEMCNIAEEWLCTSQGFSQVTEAAGMIIAKSMKLDVESRILTERDLLDWIAQTLPIGKSLFKTRNRTELTPDEAQGITNDSLDMKFGRELHTLHVRPNSKLAKRFPAIDNRFLYIPKPVSVGQTDLLITIKFDSQGTPNYEGCGQQILKLHCPDNHEVKIVCNLELYERDSVFKISHLGTVPKPETEQFHRLVHEASKEISQLHDEDRKAAEDKLCSAMALTGLPEYFEIMEKYSAEHFMRIQAYFYLWKRTMTGSQVSLKALNETLFEVGMKKRPWPKMGKLGEPDVTVRTVIPAPPENMMFGIAAEYFNDRLQKAQDKGDKVNIGRYTEYLKHLGMHPAKKRADQAKYKKKFFGTVFKNKRKDPKDTSNLKTATTIKNKKKVTREPAMSLPRGSTQGTDKRSFLKSTRRLFSKSNKNTTSGVPENVRAGSKWESLRALSLPTGDHELVSESSANLHPTARSHTISFAPADPDNVTELPLWKRGRANPQIATSTQEEV